MTPSAITFPCPRMPPVRTRFSSAASARMSAIRADAPSPCLWPATSCSKAPRSTRCRSPRLCERDQRRHFFAVALVLAGEGFAHETLLGAHLDRKRDGDDDDADPGAQRAGSDGGA